MTLTSQVESSEQERPTAIAVPDGTIEIIQDRRFSRTQQQILQQWIVESAKSLSDLTGKFPLKQSRIILKRASYGDSPVPWAEINRDPPEGITFYVNPTHLLAAYLEDWTGAHEFSHLLIPFPGYDDIWLSEGLASHYQNILRRRQGIIDDQTLWQDIEAGFKRGKKAARRQQKSLRELSEQMYATGSYKRVYWSGAAYFLLADARLQKLGNGHSVNRVIAEFQHCCRRQAQQWDGQALISEFDRLSKSKVFSQLYAEIIDQSHFPDTREAYQWFGILHVGHELQLESQPPYPQRRHKLIFSPILTGG